MTSDTNTVDAGALAMDFHSTAAQSFGMPATLLMGMLLALPFADADQRKVTDLLIPDSSSSRQLTETVQSALFDDLLVFHQQLASSQRDLPEDAARLLRDNLWQLYD
jgi:hypothetical protein